MHRVRSVVVQYSKSSTRIRCSTSHSVFNRLVVKHSYHGAHADYDSSPGIYIIVANRKSLIMNKELQHSLPLVLLSAVAAVVFLLADLKHCVLFVIPFLGAGWLTFTNWNLLIRVWQTIPRDAM